MTATLIDTRTDGLMYSNIVGGHVSSRTVNLADINYKELVPLSKRLAKSVPYDYTSPFIHEDETREDVIEELGNVIDDELSVCDVFLQELEMSERDKIGPISIRVEPHLRFKSLNDYFETNNFTPNPDYYVRAVSKTLSHFQKHRLRPKSVDSVYASSDKTTNWGAPDPTPGNVSGPLHLALAKECLANKSLIHYPCILGWRGQSSGTEIPKQRDVWMYPHSIILIELTFLHALLPLLKELDEFTMLKSVDSVSIPITRMINKALVTGSPTIGFDATGFDKNCTFQLISSAFYVLKYWFQQCEGKMLDEIFWYFVSSDIMSNGVLKTGRMGGVPSGSGFTNLIDSIIHEIMFNYVDIVMGEPSGSECTVMGDDGVWFLLGLTPSILSEILKDLGHTVNPLKVSFSKYYVTFCQRIFLDSTRKNGICYGIRSIYRTLNSMMSYERKPKFSGTYDSCRWITQLEECKHHPLYEKFINFSIKRDVNYSLGLFLENGPIDLFREIGFDNFMSLRGKGFLYTSQVREINDIPNLDTARYIVSISDSGIINL